MDRGVRPYKPLDIGNASKSIRQIFNGRKQSDLLCVSCARETRLDGRPKGVRTTDGVTTKRTTERIVLSSATALFRVQRLFSPHSFLARQKRMGLRSGGDGAPNQTAPSAHSNAGLKPPLRKHKAAKALLTNGAAPSRARLLLSYRSTFSKRPADVWKASVLSSSQTAAPPSRTGSCRSWSCRA